MTANVFLLAGNGDLNVKYYNGKFDAYQRTYILECKNNSISTKYLYYFMKKYVEVFKKSIYRWSNKIYKII